MNHETSLLQDPDSQCSIHGLQFWYATVHLCSRALVMHLLQFVASVCGSTLGGDQVHVDAKPMLVAFVIL